MVQAAPVARAVGDGRVAYDADVLLQRLFGVGVALNGLLTSAHPEVADRIVRALEEVDETINDIRLAAFSAP
jgi:ABC-type nitrate/sulfonate/bicarbonate transport system substrate-binding protein